MTGYSSGRFAIIEQLLADDIHYMFGNPGTVEEGFLNAMDAYPDMHYILALHETVALAMADGYARVTKHPAVVQLHSGVGLGNGIGMLYQAYRGHAPLIVLAGEAGLRYDAMDAQMAADLVAIARPVTKWATRVVDSASVLRVLRRAIKTALTAPMGPVFVSLPMDILDAPCLETVFPTSLPATQTTPPSHKIAEVAALLAGATDPLFIVGDGIAASRAVTELTQVAELCGAAVWGADFSEVNINTTHPLFRGQLGHMFGEHSRSITSQADVVLICGTYVFPEVFPALSEVFASSAKVIHIDLDAYEIAKNFPVDVGLVCDPKNTLALLAIALETIITGEQKERAKARIYEYMMLKQGEDEERQRLNAVQRDAIPLHASRFMEELADFLPKDAIIFDEALTSSPDLVTYMPPTLPGHYFLTRGGSLGVGLPGAIGIKLAHPEKTVVGFSGDGGSMYTIQALWTAAHYKIGAKFIVCNNHSYQLLKLNLQQYWRERNLDEQDFPASFDLGHPEIRFSDLAMALGVKAIAVEHPQQIGPALRLAFSDEEPYLIDVMLTENIPDHIVHTAMHKYGIA